jgi:hypothetical protein
MNNHRLFKLTVLAMVVLLVVAAIVPWRSLAARPPQASVGGVVGPHDPARIAASAPADPVEGGPAFQMVNAFQFRSAFPNRTWDYFNGELFNPGPEDNFYEAALSLPNNVTITGMVVYFYDNSAQDLIVGLWRFDPSTGNSVEMATVASSDAQDQYRNAADTSIIEPTVDQQSYSYVIEVGMYAGNNTLRLAGVRIDYGYAVQLPIVTKNH